MSQARPKGTGSVYQRSDGRWIAAVKVNGKKVVRYAKSEREAKANLQALLVAQYQGRLTAPSQITLGEWVDHWLSETERRVRPTTISTYRQVLKIITDRIGETKLSRLTPLMLNQTFARLRDAGRGERQLHLAYGYLKACLAQAVELEVIGSNPINRVRKPHWTPKQRTYWSTEEASRFLHAALTSSTYYSPLFAVLTVTGLRVSEALGLTWSDVDLEKRQLQVERALVRCEGRYILMTQPKTKAGRRTVSLPAAAVAAFEQLQNRNAINRSDPIFRTLRGTVPLHSDLRKRLAELCQRSGVPIVNVHGLRHVAAMLALEATGDAYLVQQRLGHSHISVTLGIYGYTPRQGSTVATDLDRLLAQGGQQTHADSRASSTD
jgi:integrase